MTSTVLHELTDNAFYNGINFKKEFTKLMSEISKFRKVVTLTLKEDKGFRVIPVDLGYIARTFNLRYDYEIKYLNVVIDDNNDPYIITAVGVDGKDLLFTRHTFMEKNEEALYVDPTTFGERLSTYRKELDNGSKVEINKTNDPYLLDIDRLLGYFEVYGY